MWKIVEVILIVRIRIVFKDGLYGGTGISDFREIVGDCSAIS